MASELVEKIGKLKKDRQAVILVHNYQIPEVQDIANYLGDSLELAQQAVKTKAKVIVFCGVHFMAETVAILNPDKIVLMPDVKAGCPMADMITTEQLQDLKKKHPQALVVSYVNTTAAVKAETDTCCTSANAVKVVNSLPKDQEIIFTPDKYLGDYVEKQTGRKMILWNGYCPTHVRILPEDIKKAKAEHPEAEVMVHPECIPETIALADGAFSTSGMVRHAKESKAKEFIIGTETGLIYRLQKENSGKKFYPATAKAICPNMKLNNLEKILWSLEDMKTQIKIPPEIQKKAVKSIERMLEIA